MTRFSPEVEAAIAQAAARHGVPVERMRGFARIESSGNPTLRTGSYRGLYQLGPDEWRRYGGGADINDPAANADAAARKLNDEARRFKAKFGRDPSNHELYLLHQQGEGGAAAHLSNPNELAWKNMAGTGEGRQRGEAWAKQAIWGNVPSDVRAKYGSVDNLTSAQFVELWRDKVARFTGEAQSPAAGAPQQPAGAPQQPQATNIAAAAPAVPESTTGFLGGMSNLVSKAQTDGLASAVLPDQWASAIKSTVGAPDAQQPKLPDPLADDGFLQMPRMAQMPQAARMPKPAALPKMNYAQLRAAFRRA